MWVARSGVRLPRSRAIFPDAVVSRAPPHPLAIAAEIEALLTDHERRARQAEAGLRWVAQFDWEKSARDVECAILEKLLPSGKRSITNRKRPLTNGKHPPVNLKRSGAEVVKVSVCIPTHNGGELLRAVVQRICIQRAPWPFEIIIVDSSSSDGSLNRLTSAKAPGSESRGSRRQISSMAARAICALNFRKDSSLHS